jgi:hypothetical protein
MLNKRKRQKGFDRCSRINRKRTAYTPWKMADPTGGRAMRNLFAILILFAIFTVLAVYYYVSHT